MSRLFQFSKSPVLKEIGNTLLVGFTFAVALGSIVAIDFHLFLFWFFGVRVSVGEPNRLFGLLEFLVVALGGLSTILMWRKVAKGVGKK